LQGIIQLIIQIAVGGLSASWTITVIIRLPWNFHFISKLRAPKSSAVVCADSLQHATWNFQWGQPIYYSVLDTPSHKSSTNGRLQNPPHAQRFCMLASFPISTIYILVPPTNQSPPNPKPWFHPFVLLLASRMRQKSDP
jgi:hypothetical protein